MATMSATLGVFYHSAQTAHLEESRSSLARTAALAATFVDGDDLDQIIREGRDDTPEWNLAVEPLRKVLTLSGDVRYAYVMRLDGDSVRFVLDASPEGDHDSDGVEDYSPIGSSYPWAAPELLEALRKGTRQVDLSLIQDPWGVFLSAYAPVRNSRGVLMGVVGVDLDASDWIQSRGRILNAFLLGLLLAATASVLAGLGTWAFRRRSLAELDREREDEIRKREQAMQFARELEAKVQARTMELSRTNQDLQKALRTREAFLATANHELRTPLQSLLTSAEMLSQGMLGPLNASQSRRLATIRRCGRHLLDLITQVLDLSRARSGTVELFLERIDLEAVCEEILEILADEARSIEIQTSMQILPQARWVEADALRLRQILLNLLGNALKFSPPGGSVSIETELVPQGDAILLTITDSGPGISEEQRPNLFRSLDDVAILSQADLKLGLPLAAWLASLHGGSLRYEPAPGGGSRFRLRLPSSTPHPDPANDFTPSPGSSEAECGLRVLIAEDNPDIRETLCEFLEAKGCQVTLASDGREAVEQASRVPLDLILMDVQMPNMDGLEATRRLRQIPASANLPIVVMTAFASGEDAERCLEAGATSYVPKPIELRRLARLLAEYSSSISRSP
jgi:signal transduction histidine kinase/ActR/RegA family two-component response regulator